VAKSKSKQSSQKTNKADIPPKGQRKAPAPKAGATPAAAAKMAARQGGLRTEG
jgi:hypothetical protein